MAHALFIQILTLGSSIIAISASGTPFQLTPSPTYYGPDGPWQAVSVTIGDQPLDLFPGGKSSSYIMTQSNCSQSTSCGAAGIYSQNTSYASYEAAAPEPYSMPYSLGAIATNATMAIVLDTLVMSSPLNPSAGFAVPPVSVSSFSMNVLSDLNMSIGNGFPYQLQAGQLSLGPTNSETKDQYNGSLIPGALKTQQNIPSSSFGLHYGSANLKQILSLWLGGYDQQRLVGPVSSQPVADDVNLQIDLLDIGIGVATGGSPFPFTSQSGLLSTKNVTIGTQLPVYMNTEAPYLYLPASTCNAITSFLPVTYNATLSLYLWDTTSPFYNPIITSPSYLSFTFRASSSSIANLTINVPFTLLNLTLAHPLVETPTPYFPCQPPPFDGTYSLGRAFLQAAFIGANWDKQPGEWYLAQAPGPNIASQPSQVPFGSGAVTASSNTWADTWKDNWTPLAANSAMPSGTAAPATASPTPTGSGGLSGGVIAGIVIGVLAGLGLVIAVVLVFCLSRRRQQRRSVGGGGGSGSEMGMAAQQQKPFLSPRPLSVTDDPKAEEGQDQLHEMATPEGRPVELFDEQNQKGDAELDSTLFGGSPRLDLMDPSEHGGSEERHSRAVSSL